MRRPLAKIRLKNRQKYKANGKWGDKRQEFFFKKKGERQITGCRNRAVIRGKKTEICPKKGSKVMYAKYNFILFFFSKRAIK